MEPLKDPRQELQADGHEIVALSKIVARTPEAIAEAKKKLKRATKKEPLALSAHSGEGVQDALRALLKVIAKSRREEAKEKEEAWRP